MAEVDKKILAMKLDADAGNPAQRFLTVTYRATFDEWEANAWFVEEVGIFLGDTSSEQARVATCTLGPQQIQRPSSGQGPFSLDRTVGPLVVNVAERPEGADGIWVSQGQLPVLVARVTITAKLPRDSDARSVHQ